jgi:hypothetical protein
MYVQCVELDGSCFCLRCRGDIPDAEEGAKSIRNATDAPGYAHFPFRKVDEERRCWKKQKN